MSARRMRIAELAAQNRGWTMRMVAEALGVDHQTVLFWNQGRSRPRFQTLLALCRLLDCQLQDLVPPSEWEVEDPIGDQD